MGINGISGFQTWNIPREIPRQNPNEEIQNTGLENNPSALPQTNLPEENDNYAISKSGTAVADQRSRIADLEDVSLTFNKEESFDYIGSESGLDNLDMQKAISDMKKDEVLQGYQYFVGSAQNLALQNSDDGAVFRKLGF